MDERFYRGAKPRKNGLEGLARLGIGTIIDLREQPDRREQLSVEAIGMRYINIPMNVRDCPGSEPIKHFLRIVNDPATGKFFVHCAGGRHRTGVIGAVYRLQFNQWNYEQAYREMKSFKFYTRWGHGALKKFVEDYWRTLSTNRHGLS